ncbi:unnamed protein product [Cylicostephanus goldi]|uniref:Uncharacterized protein n=1 Tax=Cylicostephanus goldi TaxID=71465 RepID=A0A3P6R0G7_CYLGO|nr:unnamed protein product [Cylicostephanus goldi]
MIWSLLLVQYGTVSECRCDALSIDNKLPYRLLGPEEGGPPRKKVKSPPAISPTGSSTSIYSGGSSSIDWKTVPPQIMKFTPEFNFTRISFLAGCLLSALFRLGSELQK